MVDGGRDVQEKRRGWMFYPPLDLLSVFDRNAQMAAIARRLGEPAKSTRMRVEARPTEPWTPLRFEAMALRHQRRTSPSKACLICRWKPMFELDPGRVKRPCVEVLDIVERLRQKFRGDW